MTAWHTTRIVRFAHCDPAGIVYYPRYFEVVHDVKEDWLREAVGVSLPALIGERGRGLPIVRLEADFLGPSRLGEALDFAVGVTSVGRSSVDVRYDVRCGSERRLAVRTVLVHIGLREGRPVPIDDDLRLRLERFRTGDGAAEGSAE